MCGLIPGFSIGFPWSIFEIVPSYFQDYSFIIELEVLDGDYSRNSFIVKGCFGYPGSFVFPYKVKNFFQGL